MSELYVVRGDHYGNSSMALDRCHGTDGLLHATVHSGRTDSDPSQGTGVRESCAVFVSDQLPGKPPLSIVKIMHVGAKVMYHKCLLVLYRHFETPASLCCILLVPLPSDPGGHYWKDPCLRTELDALIIESLTQKTSRRGCWNSLPCSPDRPQQLLEPHQHDFRARL